MSARIIIEIQGSPTEADMARAADAARVDIATGRANEGTPIGIGGGDTCVYRVETDPAHVLRPCTTASERRQRKGAK